MAPKFNDFSLKYIVRMGRNNGEKILDKKKLQSNAEHLLTLNLDKNKNKQ